MKQQYFQIGRFIRKNNFWCLIALLVFAELVVYCWVNVSADNSYEQYVSRVRPAYSGEFWFILIENLKSVLFLVGLGAVPLGLGTVCGCFFTVRSLVATMKHLLPMYGATQLFACLAPHGIIELTALLSSVVFSGVLSKATSTFIGTVFFKKESFQTYADDLVLIGKGLLLVVVPMVIFAATIEMTVSRVLVTVFLK